MSSKNTASMSWRSDHLTKQSLNVQNCLLECIVLVIKAPRPIVQQFLSLIVINRPCAVSGLVNGQGFSPVSPPFFMSLKRRAEALLPITPAATQPRYLPVLRPWFPPFRLRFLCPTVFVRQSIDFLATVLAHSAYILP